MQWYYAKDGQRQGPLEDGRFRELIANGALAPTDLVWNSGFGDEWKQAATVPGLFARTDAAAPPPLKSGSGPFSSRTHNRDLMAAARTSLRGNWSIAVVVCLIYTAIGVALGILNFVPFLGTVVQLLIDGSLLLGMAMFYLVLSRGVTSDVSLMFAGFKRFGPALGAYLLMAILVFLWMLLLIVPGIVAMLRYSQTYFVLADNPNLGPLEAIRRSKQLMRGNKWKCFSLQWRFFGWALLCLLTCGIGFLWLMPYMQVTSAKFYDDLKVENG